jgi:nudix-type nucleoside diphosphatase (YffH/AdpP family)
MPAGLVEEGAHMHTREETAKILEVKTLSDDWHSLKKYTFEYRRKTGELQRQEREVYDTGGGATVLLYNLEQRTVILTRQFRMPAYLIGHADGMMIETPAGMLEDENPEERIKDEIEEETGYAINQVAKVFEAQMSPGSILEHIHFFIAAYSPVQRENAGGGLKSEGEDIEVLELAFEKAWEMMVNGDIIDAKTMLLLHYAAQNLFQKHEK